MFINLMKMLQNNDLNTSSGACPAGGPSFQSFHPMYTTSYALMVLTNLSNSCNTIHPMYCGGNSLQCGHQSCSPRLHPSLYM